MEELRNRIISYWDRRAPSYTEVVEKNLAGEWDAVWANMLISGFPEGDPSELRVLDMGTGPGFYAIILPERGYRVTAVDFSENMLAEARKNAGPLAEKISFLRMDAQAPDFPDDSFDVIVTRNLTWNLTDPEKAYREWRRILRPGGAALIFDANWYAYLEDEEKKAEWDRDRENASLEGVEDHDSYPDSRTMEDISRTLPLTPRRRPQWDLVTMLDLGYSEVSADVRIHEKVWNREEKINYASTPGFLIRAVK